MKNKSVPNFPLFRANGSSPHVRGTHPWLSGIFVYYRFIPACAGNTPSPSWMTCCGSVHPRMCGEHAYFGRARVGSTGSSPHVRGTPPGSTDSPGTHRFIPACAGNTWTRCMPALSCPVHPRMCGEHDGDYAHLIVYGGSSPHVRGTPHCWSRSRSPFRFIPACAGNTVPGLLPPPRRPVHPRMCGEHAQCRNRACSYIGSSPHVRGTPLNLDLPLGDHRFIPACAGNTLRLPTKAAPCTVHPRMCGEHHLSAMELVGRAGSSPHVRGTQVNGQDGQIVVRFIPACAGNTINQATGPCAQAVHPRMCGEHRDDFMVMILSRGSSPHVRGTRAKELPRTRGPRFIPACAGNTLSPTITARYRPVHPRMCGEHLSENFSTATTPGSSPHVRGTRAPMLQTRDYRRFIPACAGNTYVPASACAGSAVHPRMCGEHRSTPCHLRCQGGSSPHVRGTQRCRHDQRQRLRFIPACAGNTRAAISAFFGITVHPRMCGEHISSAVSIVASNGSSPHVRGTLRRHPLKLQVSRFIPACAGNTPGSAPGSAYIPVHPRMCGEHRSSHWAVGIFTGSSPHVRGTRLAPALDQHHPRFIPACAGNTPMDGRQCSSCPVHPRMCGEHLTRHMVANESDGSSPHVRGTLLGYQ